MELLVIKSLITKQNIFPLLNQPVRSSTNVCVPILFFADAGFDDNALMTGEGNKPAFNILRDLTKEDYRPCGVTMLGERKYTVARHFQLT